MKVNALKNHPSTKLAKKLKQKHPKIMKSLIKQSLAPLVLSAPATIGTIIKKEKINIGKKLKVLVYGARQVEILDECSWYKLIPDLLNKDFDVEVVAYGRNMAEQTTSQVKLKPNPIPFNKYSKLDKLLADHPAEDFDMAICFAHDPKSLSQPEEVELLGQLHLNHIPVYLSHYTVFSGALSAFTHVQHGYYPEGLSYINNYALPEDPNTNLAWGSVIYSLRASSQAINPLALNGLNHDEAIQELAGVAMHLSKKPTLNKAQIVHMNMKNQFHLIEGVYLDIENDVLHAINDDLSVQQVPKEEITKYTPNPESSRFELLIWSMLTTLHFSKTQYAAQKEVVNA